jgi:hypothetical protein
MMVGVQITQSHPLRIRKRPEPRVGLPIVVVRKLGEPIEHFTQGLHILGKLLWLCTAARFLIEFCSGLRSDFIKR